jgi:hypothetical protein
MMKFYNDEIKNRFLNEVYENEQSRDVIGYIFEYSRGNEEVLGKDLYDFTVEEIGLTISNSSHLPRSVEVAMARGRYISRYITWAIKNNLRRGNINPLQGMDEEWYSQFIDKDAKQFISKAELSEMESVLVNYQDIALLRLLFNGVYGYESSEIRNLKITDISDDRTLRLYDDRKGERHITVDESTIVVLRKAYEQSSYKNKNGDVEGRNAESLLPENEYIIKPTLRGKMNESDRVTQPTIMKRMRNIAQLFDMPDLNPKSVNRSGMIYLAYKILKEENKNEVDRQILNIIGDRFNLNKTNNNGYINYNTYAMGKYINIENISKLYPDFNK